MKMKGVYIVSETECLRQNTGANRHIQVGLRGLSKNFEMKLIFFCKSTQLTATSDSGTTFVRRSAIYRFLKWVYVLINNHRSIFKYFKALKKESPVFVYERANYLNYNGLIISRLLRIPHMYEVNGILALDYAKYYPRICNQIALRLEKLFLKKTFGFYVGGINKELGIPETKAMIIQNGTDKEFLEHFEPKKNTGNGVLDVVFIGHGMEHHKLDLLAKAFRYTSSPKSFRLHLIGSRLESVVDDLPKDMEVVNHGSLSHEEIKKVVFPLQVGVIPFSKDYFSHVKLFMYGAAKLAVILPRSRNYQTLFGDEEVLFIENGNHIDLAGKLTFFLENNEALARYSENLYKKVSESFTWDKIYEEISASIKARLEAKRS